MVNHIRSESSSRVIHQIVTNQLVGFAVDSVSYNPDLTSQFPVIASNPKPPFIDGNAWSSS